MMGSVARPTRNDELPVSELKFASFASGVHLQPKTYQQAALPPASTSSVHSAPEACGGRQLAVATYNVHRCVGADGWCRPARIAEVLAELDADVIALQEIHSHPSNDEQDSLGYLARALDAVAIPGATRVREGRAYGNALLLRRGHVRRMRTLSLAVGNREPRGAIVADLEIDDLPIRIIATHFGLRRSERAVQLTTLLTEAVEAHTWSPLVIMGDMNEWLVNTGARRALNELFGTCAQSATFPSRFPLFRLDGVWARPASALVTLSTHVSSLARRASDHLPVRAVIDLQTASLAYASSRVPAMVPRTGT